MKRRNSLLFASLLAISLAGCAGVQKVESDKPFIQAKAAEANRTGADAYARGEYSRALDKFLESLRINRSIDNRAGEVLDLINIGRVYTSLGHYKDAVNFLNDSVRLGVSLKDDKMLSEAYATLAKADYLGGDSVAALDHIAESIQLDEKLGIRSGAKLNLKAVIFIETERRSEAAEALKSALALNKSSKDELEIANSCRAIAEIHRFEGRHDDAFEYFKMAYDIDKNTGDSKKIALDLERMAELHLKAGRNNDAIFLFERSYIVNLNSGYIGRAVQTLDLLIDACRISGNDDKAVRYSKMRDSILSSVEVEKVNVR